jgi:hypothetical protein
MSTSTDYKAQPSAATDAAWGEFFDTTSYIPATERTVVRHRDEPRFVVDLMPPAVDVIRGELRADVANGFRDGETGGWLLGRPSRHLVLVLDATGPGPDAVRERTTVELDFEFGMHAARQRGLEVLGGWHSHPSDDDGEPVDGALSDGDKRTAAKNLKTLRRTGRQQGWTFAEVVASAHMLDEWRIPVLSGSVFCLGDSLEHPVIVEPAKVEPAAVRL